MPIIGMRKASCEWHSQSLCFNGTEEDLSSNDVEQKSLALMTEKKSHRKPAKQLKNELF